MTRGMRHIVRLAVRYLMHHRVRTLLLVACIALVFLLSRFFSRDDSHES